METFNKNQLLETIGSVYDQAKESKFDECLLNKIDDHLVYLGEYFKVNKIQAFFVSLILTLNYKGNTADVDDLSKHLDCNPLKLLQYSDDIEVLVNAGILKKEKSNHRMKLAMSNDQFSVNELISESILKNKPLPTLNKISSFTDVIELFEELMQLTEQRENEEISTFELKEKGKILLCEYNHFEIVKLIQALDISIVDELVFVTVVWKSLMGKMSVDLSRIADCLFDNVTTRVRYIQDFLSGNNELIKSELIEIEESAFFNDSVVKLSDKSIGLLQEHGLQMRTEIKRDHVLYPENIAAKQLFFTGSESSQLDMLRSLLNDDNLKQVQSRLLEKALPKGITVLLHGYPGTGKTESVFQLAQQTNRTVMKVDISQSKSMWFGESEKVIKRIFTDYWAYAKECDKAPILLFNEADAIISKRKDASSSNVAQTENAIQNIILEELENFDGIFMATTNLVKNIDSAFDRRFLFKVEFSKPDTSAKAMIWQSKLPWLAANDCQMLAKQFDFSGGQIDNVVRKVEVDSIINDNVLTYESVVVFCNQEMLVRESRGKVGF